LIGESRSDSLSYLLSTTVQLEYFEGTNVEGVCSIRRFEWKSEHFLLSKASPNYMWCASKIVFVTSDTDQRDLYQLLKIQSEKHWYEQVYYCNKGPQKTKFLRKFFFLNLSSM